MYTNTVWGQKLKDWTGDTGHAPNRSFFSLLSCREHHIRIPGETECTAMQISRGAPCSILKLDIISDDDIGKQAS